MLMKKHLPFDFYLVLNLFSEELGTICNFSSYWSTKVYLAVSLFDPITDDVYFIYKLDIILNTN